MAGEFAGKAKFGMADVQKSKIHENYDVSALPTTIILKDGKVSGTVIGAALRQSRRNCEQHSKPFLPQVPNWNLKTNADRNHFRSAFFVATRAVLLDPHI